MSNMQDWMVNQGLDHLPNMIFKLLDTKTLYNCRCVCKTWDEFINFNARFRRPIVEDLNSFLEEKVYRERPKEPTDRGIPSKTN